jgi:hypothetical protein
MKLMALDRVGIMDLSDGSLVTRRTVGTVRPTRAEDRDQHDGLTQVATSAKAHGGTLSHGAVGRRRDGASSTSV